MKMAAGLSREQFNAMARRRLQSIAKDVGGIYCRGLVLCDGGVQLSFRRINASNGECAAILIATNMSNGKVVESSAGGVLEMIAKAKSA
jgi:hypothetical protein